MGEKRRSGADGSTDYAPLDLFKQACLAAGRSLEPKNFVRYGVEDVAWSRGESVYLMKWGDHYLGHVHEGLGTKNLAIDGLTRQLRVGDQCAIAAAMGRLHSREKEWWRCVGVDTVAMMVNDMATLGVAPLNAAMHLAVASGSWFEDEQARAGLIAGFRDGCARAGCAWGCGETPELKGVVCEGAVELSGSVVGLAAKKRLIRRDIEDGDAIVLLGSNGVHANGLTRAREIAAKHPQGYLAELPEGMLYGEALLQPTLLYSELVQDLLDAQVDIHYGVHITGHGYRKLMRLEKPFRYVIEALPEPPPVFRFIQERARLDDRAMYGTYNMGAGFALILPKREVKRVRRLAPSHGIAVVGGGTVEKTRKGKREVVLAPLRIDPYVGEELQLR